MEDKKLVAQAVTGEEVELNDKEKMKEVDIPPELHLGEDGVALAREELAVNDGKKEKENDDMDEI